MTHARTAGPDKMIVVGQADEVRAAVGGARQAERSIGFVPTMGALHTGHISLIEAARKDVGYVVVSIYVNPTQFGPAEDYGRYPRTMETDLAACRQAGADLVFTPTDQEMYPPGDQTRVRPGGLAEPLCGAFRPGHFEGVCTVVAKLFNIVQPDMAYFGQKDAQQALVIRRMVRDLFMPIRIQVCPLVREPDGLAMSSRNARLGAEERRKALCLHKALCIGRDQLPAGEGSIGRIVAAMRACIVEHGGSQVQIDYLSIVDSETLEQVARPQGRVLVAGAIRVGQTRLIDNVVVNVPEGELRM